jgi:hypothetical protein
MPYITEPKRRNLARGSVPHDPGELTYALTATVIDYVDRQGLSFQTISDVIGSLAQTADEFRRRIVHPYEAAKAASNGDVYARLTRLLP